MTFIAANIHHQQDVKGEQIMVILCDRYGNEKSLLLGKADLEGKLQKRKKSTRVSRQSK